MIKYYSDIKKRPLEISVKGSIRELAVEVMVLIKNIYEETYERKPEAAQEFKNTIIAGCLDPNSPIWKIPITAVNRKVE